MDGARTTLMAFFDYNSTNEESRRYLYQEFPEHYVYLRKDRRWKPRQRGLQLGACIIAILLPVKDTI